MSEAFDFSELEELGKEFETLVKQYPKEARRFLREKGNQTTRKLRANTKAVTRKHTGNLQRGIKRGKVYKHGEDELSVRSYNKAPHSGLIEHGHVLWVNGTKTEKFVPGRHPGAKTALEMKNEPPTDVEAFVDQLLDENLHI